MWRFSGIRPFSRAADSAPSTRQRGQLVRQLAGQDHAGPHNRRRPRRGAPSTAGSSAYRNGGFEALAPVSAKR